MRNESLFSNCRFGLGIGAPSAGDIRKCQFSERGPPVAVGHAAIIILDGPCNAAFVLEPKWRWATLVPLWPTRPRADLGEISVAVKWKIPSF